MLDKKKRRVIDYIKWGSITAPFFKEMEMKDMNKKTADVMMEYENKVMIGEYKQSDKESMKQRVDIYKQMMDELEKLGVKPIEAVGQEFDPNFHNAVMQVESEEFESGVVAQELLKGYMYHESVVRHSMVAVVP